MFTNMCIADDVEAGSFFIPHVHVKKMMIIIKALILYRNQDTSSRFVIAQINLLPSCCTETRIQRSNRNEIIER